MSELEELRKTNRALGEELFAKGVEIANLIDRFHIEEYALNMTHLDLIDRFERLNKRERALIAALTAAIGAVPGIEDCMDSKWHEMQ